MGWLAGWLEERLPAWLEERLPGYMNGWLTD